MRPSLGCSCSELEGKKVSPSSCKVSLHFEVEISLQLELQSNIYLSEADLYTPFSSSNYLISTTPEAWKEWSKPMSAPLKVHWNSSDHLHGLTHDNHHAVLSNCAQNWHPEESTCKTKHVTIATDTTELQPWTPTVREPSVLNCALVHEITTTFCLDCCLHCKHALRHIFVRTVTWRRTHSALWAHSSIFIKFIWKGNW